MPRRSRWLSQELANATGASPGPALRKRGRKPKAQEISWARNPDWSVRLVATLRANESIRHGLFCDFKSKKNPPPYPRAYYWAQLAKEVFQGVEGVDIEKEDVLETYAESVGNYLDRIKNEYKKMVIALNEAGNGVSTEGSVGERDSAAREPEIRRQVTAEHLEASYRAKWPWWDDLHSMFSQMPHMNPIGRAAAQASSARAITVEDDRGSVVPVVPGYRPIRPANNEGAAQRPDPTVAPTPATPEPQPAPQTPAGTAALESVKASGSLKRKFGSSDMSVQEALANSVSALKAVVDATVLQAQVQKDQDVWEMERKIEELEQDEKDREEARKNMQLERELRRKRAKFDAQLELYKTDMALYGQGVLLVRPVAPTWDDSEMEE